MQEKLRRRGDRLATAVLGAVVAVWVLSLLLLAETGNSGAGQLVSNVGLAAIACAAGATALLHARRATTLKRFWVFLGLASLSWSAGQAVWTWYESVLGREVPFPSLADVGYLGMPPLAAAALLSLPLAASTLAGRARTILDGLVVAASLLLVSWVLVLATVVNAGAESMLNQVISLAYPVGDTVVITIVLYTWLRTRQPGNTLPVSLPLVGVGLVAFAVSDSGFVYLTTTGAYSSGSLIDIGWFLGFTLILRAALVDTPHRAAADADPSAADAADPAVATVGAAVRAEARPDADVRARADAAAEDAMAVDVGNRQLGTLLPYAAVTVALLTAVIELVVSGRVDKFVVWDLTALTGFLVARQILTLRENWALTRDLEARVQTRTAELDASRQRFAALAQHSSDVVTVVDRSGLITYQSESCMRVLGRSAESMTGRSVWDLMVEDEAVLLRGAIDTASQEFLRMQTVQNVWHRGDLSECHLEVTITNLLDNASVAGLVLNSRDVTDRTILEKELLHQAFHDSLTTLSNRAMFKNRLEHALTRRDRKPGSLAVLFLDLDGFKEINDTLGHSSGDHLLQVVAQRLREVVRPEDTVARFGGDEFAVLVEDMSDLTYTITLAERVNAVVREPLQLATSVVHVSASVGIAHHGDHASDAEQLLRNADLAMYQAKSARTGGYALYDPSMHAGLVERVRLEADLRAALDSDGLEVYYQPLINMRTGGVSGVEALARWEHPDLGPIQPTDFIPLAESTGLIRALGEWILQQACWQTVQWQRESPELSTLKISVNVSARQLYDGDMTHTVRKVLDETGLPPECLTLEMTESVLLDDSGETLSTLRAIRAMGVRLAIDDFGTGYSSLSYLHRFPVDVLKIDRSFIERLSQGGDASLVNTIVRLGHTMDLETVAEGIERADEMLMLRRQGCTTGQGYHFSRPLPADEFHDFLVERTQTRFLPDQPPRVEFSPPSSAVRPAKEPDDSVDARPQRRSPASRAVAREPAPHGPEQH